jgi:hypothetical protein
VTSGYANHAAFAEKSVGKPTFALTRAFAANHDLLVQVEAFAAIQ